jgi:hypothetical protein
MEVKGAVQMNALIAEVGAQQFEILKMQTDLTKIQLLSEAVNLLSDRHASPGVA